MACDFLLRAHEKVTKEKGTSDVMASGSPSSVFSYDGARLHDILSWSRSFVLPAQMPL